MNYFYNGVELPALPEWDREKYPYALLAHQDWLNDTKLSILICYSAKPPSVYINESNAGITTIVEIPKPFIECRMLSTDSGWRGFEEYTGDGVANRSGIWSNTDIYYDNGTLYLAATDPVPVVTTPDPKSMLMGWLVGRRIAKQRGKA